MTVVMRGGQAGGDSPQENVQNAPATTQPPQQQPQQQTPGPSTASPPTEPENGQGDTTVEMTDDQEPEFPVQELTKLDEMINRPRWVVPVLPKGELEILLEAATKLCKDGKMESIFISYFVEHFQIFCNMN
jgi:ubiquitin carboxyl-terminal hydrolase 9/24